MLSSTPKIGGVSTAEHMLPTVWQIHLEARFVERLPWPPISVSVADCTRKHLAVLVAGLVQCICRHPVQLECTPCAAGMQAACSYNPGPVRLECRRRAAGMQACSQNANNVLAPRVSSQCQRQGKIISWRPETAANANAKVRSHRGAPSQQRMLAPR